jgi:hypothetical protein
MGYSTIFFSTGGIESASIKMASASPRKFSQKISMPKLKLLAEPII